MTFSRRATFISLLFLTSLALLASLILQRGFPILDSDETLGSNLTFLALINVNIISVMILAFVVCRNIIRLIIDRRRNILGAKLRTRLVFAFVFLSMVPTILLFLVAKGMVGRVLQDWFSPKVEVALDSSREIAKNYYEYLEGEIIHFHEYKQKLFLNKIASQTDYKNALEDPVNSEQLGFTSYLLDNNGKLLTTTSDQLRDLKVQRTFIKIYQNLILTNLDEIKAYPDFYRDTEFMVAYSKVKLKNEKDAIFVTVRDIDKELSQSIKSLLNASEDYQAFKTYHRPLASSYFLTLIVVTLLVIFAAISIAFFLSRGISVPIGLLAKGTEQIANGNLNYQIPELGDDELAVLVRGFNKMTSDLRTTTEELVLRSRYIETMLSSLQVGVFSIGTDGILKTFNNAGMKILGIPYENVLIDKPFNEVLPLEFVNSIEEINQRNLRGKSQVVSKSINYVRAESLRHLSLTISRLIDESSRAEVGLVILVDDVTDLERAQRMAAWQEVARRIAHEIKNPLTPIQLSAERIARVKSKIAENNFTPQDVSIIGDATDVIINQVQNLRLLVNEFSNFARMPKSELRLGNLNEVVKTSVDAYKNSHANIQFNLFLDENLPEIMLDIHQIERVLINLLDNSVSAMEALPSVDPKIDVTSSWDSNLGLVTLELADNGPGIAEKDRQRIFEPYYSKKPNGTGLGLAIVKTVISDHNGFIRALDNEKERGLKIRIEIPVLK